MPYGRQEPKVVEKETAVVEGVELRGHWNRMFETRVIGDYDTSTLDQITDLPGGESLGWCYQCGKCVGVCPVDIVGDYGPRKIFRKVQMGISLLDHPDLWLCTTCQNCVRVCPKEVDMIQIIPAAREAAINAGKAIPPELQKVFEATARYGNPLGENPRKRADWIKGAGVPVPIMAQIKRPVDVLWYVGSYPSYHPRGIDAARALAWIFQALGVDFAILGPEEKEDGDSMRLAGEKGLAEKLTEENIKTFKKYTFNRLVVFGPHEYNAFKNEYPKYGGKYQVRHYTQFLVEHLDRLRELMVTPVRRTVTYHDPCYLSRHNGEYEAPRILLRAIPGLTLVEMPRNRENGYCCGGGGGGMWLDSFSQDHTKMRLSDRRVIEAVETGAQGLAICCPYEVSRFEDAVKATGNEGRLDVRDIAELIDQAMKTPA
ncbi:MAG: (Fe-S)-binding protein [Candidatus Rokubacteria bacterium]|nr:(Fe-S)-binding protein [Candidatus Rokubacteria bacterium]